MEGITSNKQVVFTEGKGGGISCPLEGGHIRNTTLGLVIKGFNPLSHGSRVIKG
jgi:hypothetical protein